jgi:hypothetical protein
MTNRELRARLAVFPADGEVVVSLNGTDWKILSRDIKLHVHEAPVPVIEIRLDNYKERT